MTLTATRCDVRALSQAVGYSSREIVQHDVFDEDWIKHILERARRRPDANHGGGANAAC